MWCRGRRYSRSPCCRSRVTVPWEPPYWWLEFFKCSYNISGTCTTTADYIPRAHGHIAWLLYNLPTYQLACQHKWTQSFVPWEVGTVGGMRNTIGRLRDMIRVHTILQSGGKSGGGRVKVNTCHGKTFITR